MSKKERVICGLDVGTEKICCVVARSASDDCIEVIGSGYAQSAGMRKGIVVDLEEAAAAIRKAAQEAEHKSSFSVDWVTVGVSGNHIQGVNCHGAISIEGKHHEVSMDDVTQVIQAAQTAPLPPSREVLHVLTQEFFLDSRGEIRNPVGLTGQRLDVDVHVVTCDSALMQNLINAVNKAQMRVKKVVLPQLASAQAVLMQEEREMGVAVIDIGGGTTDIALISRDALRSCSVLPVGGSHFSRDLSVGLRTSIEEAERIKLEFGSAQTEGIAEDEVVEVIGVASRRPREVPRRIICQILHDRAVEVLELIKDQISRSGCRGQLISGAVLTGGGSLLNGMLPLAEQILEMPVRQGVPQSVAGLSEELIHPVYATAVGLTMFATFDGNDRRSQGNRTNGSPRIVNKLLSWMGS